MSSPRVAESLKVSETTVNRHVTDARDRLGKTDPQFVDEVATKIAERRKRARTRNGQRLAAEKLGLTVQEHRALVKRERSG